MIDFKVREKVYKTVDVIECTNCNAWARVGMTFNNNTCSICGADMVSSSRELPSLEREACFGFFDIKVKEGAKSRVKKGQANIGRPKKNNS